jgi:16S rRNA (guanine527-N7)-methyltransferase
MQKENIVLLRKALTMLELQFDENVISKLVSYHDLLMKFASKHNLTGHKTEDKSLKLNLINSVAALSVLTPRIQGEIADVGSGAGFPGIPWSVLNPETEFFLIESKGKKAGFLKKVVKSLELKNVNVMQVNVFEVKRKFETLVFQAFGKIPKVMNVVANLMKTSGDTYIFASNVESLYAELDSFNNFKHEVKPFNVPMLSDYRRNLIHIRYK